jgi:hypothetical protein
MQNVYTLGAGDILLLGGTIYGAAARYRDEAGEPYTLVRIPYGDEEKAQGAFAHLTENLDPLCEVIATGEDRLEFRDYQKLFGMAERTGAGVQLILKLKKPPKETVPGLVR